ncbi:hypothetical protein IH601_04935 [Candidatus Bipolaricaulota bacterium]|nr:hypothetical protein [Candidatus Bipolaricaulota bacterium]TFH06529.1 MAG: hypothetical protein E4H08_10895 [Candidatus Atribacteria bacterium]
MKRWGLVLVLLVFCSALALEGMASLSTIAEFDYDGGAGAPGPWGGNAKFCADSDGTIDTGGMGFDPLDFLEAIIKAVSGD